MTMAMIKQILLHSLGAFGGTLGYAFLLNAPLNTVLPASLTGLLGYVIYEVMFTLLGQGMIFSYFVGTVVIAVICEIAARIMRMPSTIFLLTALVPLVPGYTFYCAMLSIVEHNGDAVASYGLEAVQIVAVIAVGAAVTSTLFRTMTMRALKKKS
ncbi:MAG: threonine/serine exporter family protein [Clostridia bacterium]|nr:threonine/serine exporter family protein [Clostridia bacterium]